MNPYDRARKRAAALRLILPLFSAALALAALWSLLPLPAAAPQAATTPPRISVQTELGSGFELPTLAMPAPAPVTPAPAPAAAAPVDQPVDEPVAVPVAETAAVPASWSIGISAFGWQNELDACQWVLMDMAAEVPLPIVGAHNYCGGGIVLEMQVGDTVTLGGYGYDGTYVVTGDRDASAGGSAAEAVSGMDADVVLQTCYWDDDGTERLVSLRRV